MRIGFIGVGNIAAAVVEGLCSSGFAGLDIFLSPRNAARSAALAAAHNNVRRLGSNQEVLDQSEIVFISVRPAIAQGVLKDLSFREDHTVVSLVALLNYSELSDLVRPATQVCRAIPLPSVVRHNCPIPIFHGSAQIVQLFGHLGEPLPVHDEEQLHALWSLTGLIAPYYHLLAGLSEWTVNHGVPAATANAYVANLFQSLSYLAQHADPIDFREMARHATTPGGINEQASKEISEKGANDAWVTAVDGVLLRFQF
ncbi:MAG TPA: NAD(P)-binding domain-containing protein [Puia sp.]|nr:NAD(P)-binding domain-containing protein [Puia sp.]